MFLFLLLFLLRDLSSDRFTCHLPRPVSRLFPGPHSLTVQASRIPADLNSTGSSFLPHEGQDLSPCNWTVITMQVLGPISLPTHSPQSSCCIGSLTPQLFCSLFISKTDTFYFLCIWSSCGPSITLLNEHLKNMHHRGHMETKILSIVKCPIPARVLPAHGTGSQPRPCYVGGGCLLLLRAYYVPDTVLGALHTFDLILILLPAL